MTPNNRPSSPETTAEREVAAQLTALGQQWRRLPLPYAAAHQHLVDLQAATTLPNDALIKDVSPVRTSIPAARTPRQSRIPAFVAAAVLVAMAAAIFVALSAHRAAKSTVAVHPTGTTTPTVLAFPNVYELRSVDMVSATEGWAVGMVVASGDPNSSTLGKILHLIHGQWQTQLTIANINDLNLSMDSATDGWAYALQLDNKNNYNFIASTLYHYSAGQWQPVPIPPVAGVIAIEPMSITMLSADAGWMSAEGILPGTVHPFAAEAGRPLQLPASSGTGSPNVSLVYQFKHGAWQNLAVPSGVGAISFLSLSEGWATGKEDATAAHPAAHLYHFINGTWQRVDLGFTGVMNAISLYSASDGWALGITVPTANHQSQELIFHYDGTRWQQVASLATNILAQSDQIFATGAAEAWQSYSNAVNTDTLIHYVNGVKVPLVLPIPANAYLVVSFQQDATGDLWLLLDLFTVDKRKHQAVLRYHDGVWTLFAQL